MVISFSFIVIVCNDTKKQNVLMTVVLSKRKSDGSSLQIPSPDEPRQVELESMPNLRLDPSLWMGRAFKFQGWVALLDVESEPTRVDPRLDPSLGGGEGGIKVQKHAPSMVSMPMCPGGSQTTFKTFVSAR